MSTDKKQAIMEHVRALRRMLIVSVAAVILMFLLLFYLACEPLMEFVLQPVRMRGIDIISMAVSEALMSQLKVCLIAGIVAAMPVIIWQVWSFVTPALYPHEKKLFALLFFAALLLFITGVAFCYLYVFPLAIDLFWSAGDTVATAMWSVKEYISFVMGFVLPFGFMFELPVVIYMLARHGMVAYASLSGFRKYALLIIFVVAAVLTPPDVVSQCMLALPMYILYEASAQMSRFVKPAAKM